MKGADRNRPCVCGSGKKSKRCEHLVAEIRRARNEAQDVTDRQLYLDREDIIEVDHRRGHVSKLLAVAAIMMSR